MNDRNELYHRMIENPILNVILICSILQQVLSKLH